MPNWNFLSGMIWKLENWICASTNHNFCKLAHCQCPKFTHLGCQCQEIAIFGELQHCQGQNLASQGCQCLEIAIFANWNTTLAKNWPAKSASTTKSPFWWIETPPGQKLAYQKRQHLEIAILVNWNTTLAKNWPAKSASASKSPFLWIDTPPWPKIGLSGLPEPRFHHFGELTHLHGLKLASQGCQNRVFTILENWHTSMA